MSTSNVVHQEDIKSCSNTSVKDAVQDKQSTAPEPRTQNHDIEHKMYIFIREICLLLFLVLTYAAFQNTIPKSSKSPHAFPFFPPGSVVKDWYFGQLSDAIELASESDLAFIMYYAPWDAESQSVRNEFSNTARHLHNEVHFAAINCWNPNSECRQQYSKVYAWPVLMAYPAHGRGIQYRGPRKMEYMLKFLHNVANPIIRIDYMADVSKYRAVYDAAVVARVDARLGSNDYGVYYYTALQFLERDPFRDVVFLVVTGDKESVLSLHLWNSSLTYFNEWHPDKISSWLSDNLHQVSAWVSPSGGKSESLSSYIQPGPALILFTPKNPLYSNIDYYSVLHDVALNYYSCSNTLNPIAESTRILNLFARKEYNSDYKTLKNKCLRAPQPTVITYSVKTWTNNSCAKQCPQNLCKIPSGDVDWRSPRNLQHLHSLKKCQFFRVAHRLQPALFAPLDLNLDSSFDNNACNTNTSLAFLALDSLQFYYFAEGLGIDILNLKDKTAAVILNPALETHHVMKEPFNTTNLEQFIMDYSNGYLKRTLGSMIATQKFTHFYGNYGLCNSSKFCVEELDTGSFVPTVMTEHLAVVVMYYSRKCAFCSGVGHTLLTVANILEPVKNLHFARIDGDSHALPWEYSMHHYPNILYFPSRRKSESRIFPQNVPITVTNLLSFILANVEYHIKINAMWAVCNQTLFDEDFDSCIRSIKSECIIQIGQLLKVYRLSYNNQQRRELLKHLQHLRSLHFLLENPLRRDAIEKHVKLLRFIEKVPIKIKTRL